MKAILIDDEPLARTIVKEYLQQYPQIEIAAECNNGFEGIKAIMQLQPDVVFLDIQMPKITGFEMLELIEQPPPIIFTTAFDEYAIKAFETHAIDYLLKPFSQERFGKAIDKLLHQSVPEQKTITEKLVQAIPGMTLQGERIVVKTAGKIKIIPIQHIHYLEAADDYVKIYTGEGGFLKAKTMGFYEQSLPQNSFVRLHRSYIANVQEITRIDPYEKEAHLAILKSGVRLPVSKAGYAKLKLVLGL